MSAPSGFDPTATALPGGSQIPSVPIHVQQGGSMSGGGDAEDLKEYGLGPGGIIDDVIDQTTKSAFLDQLRSGQCSVDSGDSAILKKDCWAITAVIRALIKYDLDEFNSKNETSKKNVSVPEVAVTKQEEPNDEDEDEDEDEKSPEPVIAVTSDPNVSPAARPANTANTSLAGGRNRTIKSKKHKKSNKTYKKKHTKSKWNTRRKN